MAENSSKETEQNETLLPEKPSKESKASFWGNPKTILTNITVEPMVLFFMLPFFMTSLTIQNLNLEKACRVNLNFDQATCDAMSIRNTSGFAQGEQETVQKLVASVYIWKSVVHSVCPLILLPFMGSWSDRYQRRKACILVPIAGEFFSSIMLIGCTYFFYELPLEMNIVAESIPTAITGGIKVLFMGIFTFIAANFAAETRTFRIGIMHLLFNVSMTVGFALSGVIYTGGGFYGVFSLASCLYLSGYLYGIFKVKEEKSDVKRNPRVGFFQDFFDFKNVAATLKSVFRKREGNTRMKIVLVIVLQMLVIGPGEGETNVAYMYTIYKFQWTEINYSIFQTISCVVTFFGSIFAISVFTKYLKWDDATLGIFAVMSKMFSSFLFALAPTSNIFILGIFLDIFTGATCTSTRSILTKLVHDDELGKVNSVFGMAEAILPLIYGPLYSAFYKLTIHIFPGAFFFISAGLMMPAVVILLWLYSQRVEKIQTEKQLETCPLKDSFK